MTAVGKILVFLNLIFSLVVGGFVIMIYLARTHWVDEYNKLGAQNKVLAASELTYKNEAVKAQQDADAKVAKVIADLKNAQLDLQTEIALNAQLTKDKEALKKTSTSENAVASMSVQEVAKYQQDVSKLRDTLKKVDDHNIALVKKNNELSDVATSATIQRQAVQDMNNRLEAQLQKMARDMARMRAGGGSTVARAGGENPPTESVEGLVKNTDASGLMTITIGSDAGLVKGHTLKLFRLNPSAPTQSKYLGTVRVLEATATQAVVQPVGTLRAPAQTGDRVASRILGS